MAASDAILWTMYVTAWVWMGLIAQRTVASRAIS
jgi:hypothetical protein